MNYSDSERIAGMLKNMKIKEASDIKEADLVIINTCGVRQMAEDRVYGLIYNLKTHSTKHGTHNVKIILTGCLANRKDVIRRMKNKVDLFFPINDINLFKNWIIKNFPPEADQPMAEKFKISAQKNLNKEIKNRF